MLSDVTVALGAHSQEGVLRVGYGTRDASHEPDDFSTPGTGFQVMSCPAKLPHCIQPGQTLARWFGAPYHAWFVGSVDHVNKKRTKSENVCVRFNDETYGEMLGMFVASADTYGADAC